MIPELPVLRLGLAGFTAEQAVALDDQLGIVSPGHVSWELVPFPDADGWWVNGSRTQLLPDGTVRVTPGIPTQRAIQLSMDDVDRPVAFSQPISAQRLQPSYIFQLGDLPQMSSVLQKFSA